MSNVIICEIFLRKLCYTRYSASNKAKNISADTVLVYNKIVNLMKSCQISLCKVDWSILHGREVWTRTMNKQRSVSCLLCGREGVLSDKNFTVHAQYTGTGSTCCVCLCSYEV